MMENYKISQQQLVSEGVVSAPDVLTGNTAENKLIFDKLGRLVASYHNMLIDFLMTQGAGDLGVSVEGLRATNVKSALRELAMTNAADIEVYAEGISADDVESALEELARRDATDLGIDVDGISAKNTQDAIEELYQKKADKVRGKTVFAPETNPPQLHELDLWFVTE